jgi:hypothetical protein
MEKQGTTKGNSASRNLGLACNQRMHGLSVKTQPAELDPKQSHAVMPASARMAPFRASRWH